VNTTLHTAFRRLAGPLLAVSILGLVGCHTPPQNRGTSGYRMDPTTDSPSEYGVMAPRSADLVNATDQMARDIAQRLDITNRDSPPRIFVGTIENRTSAPAQNYQVFLVRLRSQLNASGAREGLEFVRERAYIEQQRTREYGGKDPYSTAMAYQSRADYVLTCEIYDLPRGGTNYFLLSYQLVQLRDAATGPDVGPGAIVWENSYEVKFN